MSGTTRLVDGVPLDHFTGIQLALAERFNADPGVSDLPRVMRLPGFLHHKREPHLVKIIGTTARGVIGLKVPRYHG